jgi:hypothetical protein
MTLRNVTKGFPKMSEVVAVDKVDLEHIKLKLVMKTAANFDVKTDGVDVEEIVQAIQVHYKTTLKVGELAQCDVCQGYSSATDSSCPFCGIDFESIDTPEKEEAPPPPVKLEKPKAVKPAKTSKAMAAKAATAVVEAPEPTPEEEQEELPHTDVKPTLALVKTSSTALLHVDDMTVGALDEATQKIVSMKRSAQLSWWQLGRAVAHVFDTGLWKMRVEVKGKVQSQKYKSWEQYCENELQITGATTYSMMKVSKAFTEEQVEKIGGTKLNIVLQAPDLDIPEIMKDVENGATAKVIKEKVKKAREKAGVEKKHVEGHKKMPEKAKPKESGRVTVALVTGKVKLDMFAKPAKKLKDGEEMKIASKVEQEPIAIEELTNGVSRFYSVIRGSKGLQLVIETKRA